MAATGWPELQSDPPRSSSALARSCGEDVAFAEVELRLVLGISAR